MREQTKQMLRILQKEGKITDNQAGYRGIINPRREAGLLKHREGFDVNIVPQSPTKREYSLS